MALWGSECAHKCKAAWDAGDASLAPEGEEMADEAEVFAALFATTADQQLEPTAGEVGPGVDAIIAVAGGWCEGAVARCAALDAPLRQALAATAGSAIGCIGACIASGAARAVALQACERSCRAATVLIHAEGMDAAAIWALGLGASQAAAAVAETEGGSDTRAAGAATLTAVATACATIVPAAAEAWVGAIASGETAAKKATSRVQSAARLMVGLARAAEATGSLVKPKLWAWLDARRDVQPPAPQAASKADASAGATARDAFAAAALGAGIAAPPVLEPAPWVPGSVPCAATRPVLTWLRARHGEIDAAAGTPGSAAAAGGEPAASEATAEGMCGVPVAAAREVGDFVINWAALGAAVRASAEALTVPVAAPAAAAALAAVGQLGDAWSTGDMAGAGAGVGGTAGSAEEEEEEEDGAILSAHATAHVALSCLAEALEAAAVGGEAIRSAADLPRITAASKAAASVLRARAHCWAAGTRQAGSNELELVARIQAAAVGAAGAARKWIASASASERKSARGEWPATLRACSKAAGAALVASVAGTPNLANALIRSFAAGGAVSLASPVATAHCAAAAAWAAAASRNRPVDPKTRAEPIGAATLAVDALVSAAEARFAKKCTSSARAELLLCLSQATTSLAWAAHTEVQGGSDALALVGVASPKGWGMLANTLARAAALVLAQASVDVGCMDEAAAEAVAATALSASLAASALARRPESDRRLAAPSLEMLLRAAGTAAARLAGEARKAFSCMLDDMGAVDPACEASGRRGRDEYEEDDDEADDAEEDDEDAAAAEGDVSVGALTFFVRTLTALATPDSFAALPAEEAKHLATTLRHLGLGAASRAAVAAATSDAGVLLGEDQAPAIEACGEAAALADATAAMLA